ncbi:MAG TPA: RdgB/HAM1 family non-canonical purine NTP pyrophosphatase [Actinomycetota bacterium]
MTVRVALASANPGKVREIGSILGEGIEVIPPDPAWVAPPEDDATYRGNALAKARSLLELMGMPCIADDSGIEVDALEGEPGPRSARFAGPGATDEANLQKLIAIVRETPLEQRGARYRCVAVIVTPDGRDRIAEDTVEGTLITEPHGSGGFGYDPIFVPVGEQRTMAQLTAVEKDAISHRGKAFRALATAIRSLG